MVNVHRKRDCKNPEKITFKFREDIRAVFTNRSIHHYEDINGEHVDYPYVRNY